MEYKVILALNSLSTRTTKNEEVKSTLVFLNNNKKLRGQQTLEQNYLFVNMNKKQKNDLGFKKKI